MAERLPHTEGVSTFIAYSGTTVENFRNCSVYSDANIVVFDKLKEPRHSRKQIYITPYFFEAALWSGSRARELNHVQLVFSGRIPEEYRWINKLPEGMTFPVTKVWLPQHGQSWITASAYVEEQIKNAFIELDPLSLLRY